MKFEVDKKGGAAVTVSLTGVIDESAEQVLLGLTADIDESETLIFDLAGIEAINSFGIRNWLKFQTKLKDRSQSIINCPQAMLDAAVMIPTLFPERSVKTANLEYFCAKCDMYSQMQVDGSNISSVGNGPDAVCSKCNGEITVNGGEYSHLFAQPD